MRIPLTTLLGFLLLSFIAAAQDFAVPDKLHIPKEEFIKSFFNPSLNQSLVPSGGLGANNN